MYKFEIGRGTSETKAIPRILNPLLFLGMAVIGTAALTIVALSLSMLVIFAPVAWLWPMRVRVTA